MYPKSDEQRKRLNDAIKNILLFKNVEPVSHKQIVKIQPCFAEEIAGTETSK